jgi:hypothetical protein
MRCAAEPTNPIYPTPPPKQQQQQKDNSQIAIDFPLKPILSYPSEEPPVASIPLYLSLPLN